MKKLILFELNEVPQKVIDYYCQRAPNSWLAVHYPQFKKFNSYSENPHHLNPWNTWPTVHRGVDSGQHEILDLNQNLDAQNKDFPAVWDVLSKAGVKVGVFGSLHSYPIPSIQNNVAFHVPDVFALTEECIPSKVNSFQALNLNLSRKSARNVSKAVPKRKMIELAIKAPVLGFKMKTVSKISKQLVEERKASWKSTRRRTHQANLSFDIFFKLLKNRKPDFSTFYTNHVAACQHRYWAAAFPDAYHENYYEEDWIARYDGEIMYALNAADEMLSRLDAFIRKQPNYELIIASSMGQDAVKARPIHSQLYITDYKQFFQQFGIKEVQQLPAMLPQFNFKLSEENLQSFQKSARHTFINGKALRIRVHEKGVVAVEMGHINQREIVMTINDTNIRPSDSGLSNVKIEDHSSTTADHIPEGIFYSYHPANPISHLNATVVPTKEIFPSILSHFNLPTPAYCEKPNDFIF